MFYVKKDLAAMFKVNVRTIEKWIEHGYIPRGTIPSGKEKGTQYWHESSFDAWAALHFNFVSNDETGSVAGRPRKSRVLDSKSLG